MSRCRTNARDWRVRAAPPAAVGARTDRRSARRAAPPRPTSGGTLPTTLEAFHAHLAESADLPLFRAGAARALPHGPAGAELMLLTGIPTPEDAAEGKPLGGPAAKLAERMLRAVGLAPDQAYVAALTCFSGTGTRFYRGRQRRLPRHDPGADRARRAQAAAAARRPARQSCCSASRWRARAASCTGSPVCRPPSPSRRAICSPTMGTRRLPGPTSS